MNFAPVGVNVDLGIAEALRQIGDIISRRGQRQRQVIEDVLDDAEAATIAVQHLDKLFTDILGEFASRRIVEDEALLGDLVDETRKFLFGRELLPILDQRREAIRQAAGETRKETKRLRELQPLLERPSELLYSLNGELTQAARGR